MWSTENQLDVPEEGKTQSHNDSSEDSEANETEHVNRTFQQKSKILKYFNEQTYRQTVETANSKDDNSLGNLIQLSSDVKKVNEQKYLYARTTFNYFVEMYYSPLG